MLGIGVDTGGTCTDAVIYNIETKEILGSGKALTTKSNLEVGIENALDQLPQELLAQAEVIALSTTLATNACVENKGARAKLLMFGFEETMMERLKNVYASYGFTDRKDFVLMDAKVENLFPDAFDPDWEYLRTHAAEMFADCDSIGIVQKHPKANGGRFELRAREILHEELDKPITISQEISNEVDILKTCAGTILNARLIPLITEFMKAIHSVLRKKKLDIPVTIVRSDGTLMSEEMTKIYPVETLLCGPAASVIGGMELSEENSGLIVDMGGTTTDIAIVKDEMPVMEERGIRIGQWQTMVKGLYVDTFGLGGDTAVRFADNEIYLDTIRIIPISVLASQFDYVLPKLQNLMNKFRVHGRWIYEFYVLQKDISGKQGYTEEEQHICRLLKNGPMITMDLAGELGKDPYYIDTKRLEKNGIIIKSGLTPTDMMVIKGEFTMYDKAAAEAALTYMVLNTKEKQEDVPDIVYELVIRRIYKNIGRILLLQQYPGRRELFCSETMDQLLDLYYEQAKDRLSGEQNRKQNGKDAEMSLTTQIPIIGVGAPVHVFLPRVADLFQTRVIIPEYSGVTNALGAISCRTVATAELTVKADYMGLNFLGFSVFENGRKHLFRDYEEAEDFGKKVLTESITQRAKLQGILSPKIEIRKKRKEAKALGMDIFLETVLYATAE